MKFIIYIGLTMAVFLNPVLLYAQETKLEPLEVIQEDWIYYIDGSMKHLRNAYGEFEAGNFKNASYELRQANFYLIIESLRVQQFNTDLNRAISALKGLSDALGQGSVVSKSEYDKAMIAVNYTISQHYFRQAERSLENEKLKRSGHALKAAVQHLERSESLSNNEMNEQDKEIVSQSRTLFNELMNTPSKTKKEDVAPKIKKFGNVLKNFKVENEEELRIQKSF